MRSTAPAKHPLRRDPYLALGVALGVALVLAQGCATARVSSDHQASSTVSQSYGRLVVPPFANTSDDEVDTKTLNRIAGAVVSAVKERYPDAFASIGPDPAGGAEEIIVRGEITEHNPGSPVARFILIGLGAGKLRTHVKLEDGETGEVIDEFTTSGEIMAGGIMGAAMDMDDMVESAAERIAARIAPYGRPSGGSQVVSPGSTGSTVGPRRQR